MKHLSIFQNNLYITLKVSKYSKMAKKNVNRIIESQRKCIASDQVADRTVIIANIPLKRDLVSYNESTSAKVAHFAKEAGIENFDPKSIEVAYRLDVRRGIPSISVRFRTASARNNFLSQKLKLSNMSSQLVLEDRHNVATKDIEEDIIPKLINLKTVTDKANWVKDPANTYIGRYNQSTKCESLWKNPYKMHTSHNRERLRVVSDYA